MSSEEISEKDVVAVQMLEQDRRLIYLLVCEMILIILIILLLLIPVSAFGCSLGLSPIGILTALIYERLTVDCRFIGINFIGIFILIAFIFGIFWFGRLLYRLDKH